MEQCKSELKERLWKDLWKGEIDIPVEVRVEREDDGVVIVEVKLVNLQ